MIFRNFIQYLHGYEVSKDDKEYFEISQIFFLEGDDMNIATVLNLKKCGNTNGLLHKYFLTKFNQCFTSSTVNLSTKMLITLW